MKNTILIIEDDKDIRESVRILLEGEDFAVEEASDGMEGLKKISDRTNLIILDIMMPGISGIKTCEEIRKNFYVPILFLTAKSQESDKLIGFMAGADDYLAKPFSYAELLVRIKALLRRCQVYDQKIKEPGKKVNWVEKGYIRIHLSKNIVFVGGKEIQLTDIEYKILLLLAQHPAKIFSVQNIYESIWQEVFYNSSANTVMVHIRNLRIKIEKEPQNPEIIQTVWGKGYRFGQTME